MGKGSTQSTQDALQRLRFFNEKAAELKRLSFIAKVSAEDAGFTAHFEPSQLQVEKRGADQESTAALVLTLRFFLQERDGIQLEQIEQLYQQIDVPAENRYWVSENLKDHQAFLDRPTGVSIDEKPITNRMLLETFIYGHFAHANADKRTEYEIWKSGPFGLILEGLFEYVVAEVMRYIFWLQAMNAETIKILEAQGG